MLSGFGGVLQKQINSQNTKSLECSFCASAATWGTTQSPFPELSAGLPFTHHHELEFPREVSVFLPPCKFERKKEERKKRREEGRKGRKQQKRKEKIILPVFKFLDSYLIQCLDLRIEGDAVGEGAFPSLLRSLVSCCAPIHNPSPIIPFVTLIRSEWRKG